jgi:hypothetical protein
MKKILYILLLCFMSLPAFSQSIELKLDEHRVEFPSNKGGEVSGRIYNKTTDQIKIVFKIGHQLYVLMYAMQILLTHSHGAR